MVPWLTRSYLTTGNPIFPVLASKIPSRDYSAGLAVKVDAYNRYMTWGNALGREWTLEQRQFVLVGVAVLWLVVCAVCFFRSRSGLGRTTAVVIGLGGVAQLSAVGIYLRYSLPLLGVLLLPGATLLNDYWKRRSVTMGVLVCALVGALLQVRRIYFDESSTIAARLRTLVGAQDRRTFLRDALPLYPLYERANRDLPADAGIMLSGYCGGFYLDRATYCAEMVQDSLRFDSWQDFTDDLASLHITHIIAPSALATHGPTPYLGGSSVSVITRAQQYTVVRRLLEDHAREILLASDQGLYEILPSAFAAR